MRKRQSQWDGGPGVLSLQQRVTPLLMRRRGFLLAQLRAATARVIRTSSAVDLVTASLIGGDQFSVLRNYLLVGHYPFYGDVFLVDLDLAAALKVAKRLFRTGFVLVKPPNLNI